MQQWMTKLHWSCYERHTGVSLCANISDHVSLRKWPSFHHFLKPRGYPNHDCDGFLPLSLDILEDLVESSGFVTTLNLFLTTSCLNGTITFPLFGRPQNFRQGGMERVSHNFEHSWFCSKEDLISGPVVHHPLCRLRDLPKNVLGNVSLQDIEHWWILRGTKIKAGFPQMWQQTWHGFCESVPVFPDRFCSMSRLPPFKFRKGKV